MSDQCSNDVFKNGQSVAVLDACRHRAERFAQAVAKESGQSVDWHYSGGRANVLYIGDHAKVAAAVKKLTALLVDDLPWMVGECGSCYGPNGSPVTKHRIGSVLAIYAPNVHGPYRAGDPLPDDVVG